MLGRRRCRVPRWLPAGLTIAIGGAASGQAPADTDWSVATGNDASQRYAPLGQIDRDNFGELEVAWRWSSPDNELMTGDGETAGRRTAPRNHEAIPIKVGDRLYVTTGYGQIAAIDIEDGTSLWTYDPRAYARGRPTNLGFVHGGAAYWNDPDLPEGSGRLIWAAGDAALQAGLPLRLRRRHRRTGVADPGARSAPDRHRRRADVADAALPHQTAGRDDWRIETPALRAFDKATGELVGEIELPAHTDGSPITFLHRGKQYLVFALGGRGAPFELIAYRQPT